MALLNYPNGLKLNVIELADLNTATICVDLVGGYQGETQLYNGTCEIISRLMLCGTEKYPSANTLENYAKSQGFVYEISAKQEYLQICVSCLKTKVEQAIEFVYDILFNSIYDETYLATIKTQIKAEIELNKLNPANYLSTLTNQALYARTGLMNTRLGNLKSIDRITSQIIKTQLKKYLTPKNMVISIGGAVNEEKVTELIGKLFYNKLKDVPYRQIKYVSTVEGFEGFVNIKNRSYNQSRIEISFPALSFKNNDKYALDIIIKALETQIKQALATEPYFKSLHIESVNYANNGKLVFSIIVDADHAEIFMQKVLMELKNILKSNSLSKQEFLAEKNAYITRFVLSSEKADELTILSAQELVIAKEEFVLNDKFELIASITFDKGCEVLNNVIDFTKINIAYLGLPVTLNFLKDIIVG